MKPPYAGSTLLTITAVFKEESLPHGRPEAQRTKNGSS